MSRVAKKPIALPKGVEFKNDNGQLSVKGGKGTLSIAQPEGVEITVENNEILLNPARPERTAMTGTLRAILANMVKGVSDGFERKLELVGVGYRAAMQGKTLKLSVGYTHDVNFEAPEGVTVNAPKQTEIVVEGIDQQVVGQVAANIREWRQPEPYKGKGIRYKGEYVFRKEGKKK